MTIAELLDLFEYNRWAHEKTLGAAGALDSETYRSASQLRSSLQHMLAEEVMWLSRWEGHSLAEEPDYSECTDTAALMVRWKSMWNRQRKFLESLTEDDPGREVAIRMRNGIEAVQPLGDTMTHVVNHATYLRGQAATLIEQSGGATPEADYFTYCVARGSDAPDTTVVP